MEFVYSPGKELRVIRDLESAYLIIFKTSDALGCALVEPSRFFLFWGEKLKETSVRLKAITKLFLYLMRIDTVWVIITRKIKMISVACNTEST